MNYGTTGICANCGRLIIWTYGGSTGSDMWLHNFDRWKNDNGFWCSPLGHRADNKSAKLKYINDKD